MSASHEHSPTHADEARSLSDRRLVAAIGVNVLLTIGQIAGGLASSSLSLVSDALHNLSDAGSLLVALLARRTARRPADQLQTFGYVRVELVGALVNATVLVVIGLYLTSQAFVRLLQPAEVGGWMVIGVASVALLVDLATALLTYSMSRGNLNVRAAFVHNLTDALGSVAVIVVGVLVILYELHIADVVATLLIAGYAIYQGASMGRVSARILTLGAPRDIDFEELVRAIRGIDGVLDVHHLHLWELDESRRSFEAHVVVESRDLALAEAVKTRVREALEERGITHTTLELEFGQVDDRCREGEVVGPH